MLERELSALEFESLAVEILSRGAPVSFRARGQSMRPFIRDGDRLVIHPLGVRGVQRGDVVLCRMAGGTLLAHRVVKISKRNGQKMLVSQGDARPDADAAIPLASVLGRAVAVERGTRHWRLDTPWLYPVNWLLATLWPGLKKIIVRFRKGN